MISQQPYKFDEATNIWRRSDQATYFSYSDGEDVEDEILRIVKNASDKTFGSDELSHPTWPWPIEYHLAANRGNLLAPFRFEGLKVLEIGAGCGALTRFLGECAAQVVAVEGSLKRAQVASERCSGLTNVSIYCDNFEKFETDQEFDVVLAIGVAEYSPLYFGGEDAIESFFDRARRMLKGGGTLVLAIENRLGLKYFSGCREDHAGRVFYGVQDLYNKASDAVTMGREELVQKLLKTGFSALRFFYPFPDYKFPDVIFSEEGMRDKRLNAGRIIAEFTARDYPGPRASFFSERAVWPVIHRNLLAEHMSNSFLVLASPEESSSSFAPVDWLAKLFASHRVKRFRTVTTMKKVDGTIKVYKERSHPEIPVEPAQIVRLKAPRVTDFHDGETLAHVLAMKLLHPATNFSDFVGLLMPWADYLRKAVSSDGVSDSQKIVPGEFLDCTPRNLIRSPMNSTHLIYFDDEWEYLAPLPLQLVLFRGLLHFRVQCIDSGFLPGTPLKDVMIRAFQEMGFPVTDTELETMSEHEADFQCLITPWKREDWLEETRTVLNNTFPRTVFDERDLLRIELERITNSRSWKLTAALRWGHDLLFQPERR